MSDNRQLLKAKKQKDDDYYTLIDDVNSELSNYSKFFKDKIIYCNCDTLESAFVKYFISNFKKLGIKKLIATCINPSGIGYYCEYDGKKLIKDSPLKCNGDFASAECIRILKQSDIIITNPPFSLFDQYFKIVYESGKDFIILGSVLNVLRKIMSPLITKGEVKIGYKYGDLTFIGKAGNIKTVKTTWYTNLNIDKNNAFFEPKKQYNEKDYPKLNEIDAIFVDKVKNIPKDYDGIMGVPITFLAKINRDQYNLIGVGRYLFDRYYSNSFHIGNKEIFLRAFIKKV